MRSWGLAGWVLLVSALFASPGCKPQGDGPGEGSGGRPPLGCATDDGACSQNGDCCSGVCLAGHCFCLGGGLACETTAQCCSPGLCEDGMCNYASCRDEGLPCSLDGHCCGDLICDGNVCRPPRCAESGESCARGCCLGLGCDDDGVCTDACRSTGQPCANLRDCCSGYECTDGRCQVDCAPAGGACGQLPDGAVLGCCQGICQDGRCTACRTAGSACEAEGSPCCDGGTCTAGTCSCVPLDGACTYSSSCCDGTCVAGACSCLAKAEACSFDEQCCGDMKCREGVCAARTVGLHLDACEIDQDCHLDRPCTDGLCCSDQGGDCGSIEPWCCEGLVCLRDTRTCGACLPPGASCTIELECCSGACWNGACAQNLGESCAEVECRYGLTCGPREVCCYEPRIACEGDEDCCSDACEDGLCCLPPHSPCNSLQPFDPCCSGMTCQIPSEICCAAQQAPCDTDEICCSERCVDGKCQ